MKTGSWGEKKIADMNYTNMFKNLLCKEKEAHTLDGVEGITNNRGDLSVRVPIKHDVQAILEEAKAGDAFLNALSEKVVTQDKAAFKKTVGYTQGGSISFPHLFGQLLDFSYSKVPEGATYPSVITESGWKEIRSKVGDDRVFALGTGCVRGLRLYIQSAKSVALEIAFGKIPAVTEDGNGGYAWTFMVNTLRPLRFTFDLSKGNQTLEDVIEEFVDFAFSRGKFVFPNLCDVSLWFPANEVWGESDKYQLKALNYIDSVIVDCYASPAVTITVRGKNNATIKSETFFRSDLGHGLLRNARDKDENFYSYMQSMCHAKHPSYYVGDNFWKYLCGVSTYGNTYEETLRLCAEAYAKNAVENASGEALEEMRNGLFAEEEDDTPAEVADDGGVANLGGLLNEASDTEEEIATEETTDEAPETVENTGVSVDDDDDVDMELVALYGTRIQRILDLYEHLYKSTKSYKFVGYPLDSKTSILTLFTYKADRQEGDNKLFRKANAKSFKFGNNEELGNFVAAGCNLWRGVGGQFNDVPLATFRLPIEGTDNLPHGITDLAWLDKCVKKDGTLNYAWFPFIHVALMGHRYPWTLANKNSAQHSWGEIRAALEKWLYSIFETFAEMTENNDDRVEDLCEAFMRHFVVSQSDKTLTFSMYWNKKLVMTEEVLKKSYFEPVMPSVNGENVLVTCEVNRNINGLFTGNYTPDLSSYLGETLLGYEVISQFLQANGNKLDMSKVPLGIDLRGEVVTMNLTAGQKIFPAGIRSGARSGKGVLTQMLMIMFLGLGIPFVYFDHKPDMAKTWAGYGFNPKHPAKVLASDASQGNADFLPPMASPITPLNPCMSAVMNSSDFVGFSDVIYYGKLAHLMWGLISARAAGKLPIYDTYLFVDELNGLSATLKTKLGDIEALKKTDVGVAYKTARDRSLAEYKAANKGAKFLPDDQRIKVDGVGEFTVAEWDATVGADGSCTVIKKSIASMITGMGRILGEMQTVAPKTHVFAVIIGQTSPITSAEPTLFQSGCKTLRALTRFALVGTGWKNLENDAGDEGKEVYKELLQVPNNQLVNTPGVFFYKPESGRNYRVIKTGVVLAENDVDSVSVSTNDSTGESSWVGTGDMTYAMLNNIKNAAGMHSARQFADLKLRVNPNLAEELNSVGMQAEVGSPNPLVTFDGLLDYVCAKTGANPTECVDRLYDDLCSLLDITGSGFTDVYDYLRDKSAMYTGGKFLESISNGTPITKAMSDNSVGSANTTFAQKSAQLREESGDTEEQIQTPAPSGTKPTKYTAPIEPPKKNPFREESAKADENTSDWFANAKGGIGGAIRNASDAVDNFGGTKAPVNTGAKTTPDKAQSAQPVQQKQTPTQTPTQAPTRAQTQTQPSSASVASGTDVKPTPMPKPVTPTPNPTQRPVAPLVVGNDGAASRYAGGVTPVVENPDGTFTIEVPGGRSEGHYSGTATVRALTDMFTSSELTRLTKTPKGRRIMALRSMEKLVQMLEEKTGKHRAMIKHVTFEDNCLWVSDACIIGGTPDASDLYDYIDIKAFLKTMSGLTYLKMDRDAYFNLIVRPNLEKNSVFLFSKTLQTFVFDTCQLLRDGRLIGEAPDSVKDSFILDFDTKVTDNATPTSESKMFSIPFISRAERALAEAHTPEYQEKRARIAKIKRDLYGTKAEKYISDERPISGLFASIRYWMLDRKLKKLEDKL